MTVVITSEVEQICVEKNGILLTYKTYISSKVFPTTAQNHLLRIIHSRVSFSPSRIVYGLYVF